jgi:hypothetical protein
MECQIVSKTNAITHIFEQASEKQQSPTLDASTIPNLRRSIESADDRTSAVEELEEEVKVTYCEHYRLVQVLQKQTEAVAQCQKAAQDAEARISPRHISELGVMIRNGRVENAILKDKAKAYQRKLEKLNIEEQFAECQKAN